MRARAVRPSGRLSLAARDVVGPVAVLVLFLIIYSIVHPAFLSSTQITTLFNESTAIGLAALGEAIVILTGGFDLSVGSALSLINVLLVVHMRSGTGSELLWILIGLAVGAGMGIVNGLLITLLKIPSIVATLATSFLWGGLALLVLKQPGGSVPLAFSNWFTAAHAGVPNALILLVVVTIVWLLIKRTNLGVAMYAVGGDIESAAAQGVALRWSITWAYAVAGVFYGLSGIFLTAQTSSGDPNVGAPLLLTVFASVVLGGVSFAGGRGEPSASIVGAFVLTLIGDVLYAFGVSSFYTAIFNGIVLLVALIASSRGQQAVRWLRARLSSSAPSGGLASPATAGAQAGASGSGQLTVGSRK